MLVRTAGGGCEARGILSCMKSLRFCRPGGSAAFWDDPSVQSHQSKVLLKLVLSNSDVGLYRRRRPAGRSLRGP